MKGTFCGRLAAVSTIAVAAAVTPAPVLAAPPVGGAVPSVPATITTPVGTPAVPSTPSAAAVPAAVAGKAVAGVTSTVKSATGSVAAKLKGMKPMPHWKLKKVVVRVRYRPRKLSDGGNSLGGTVATCTPSGSWMVCRNLPLEGDLVNTCNNNEDVVIHGTFTEMSRVDVNPLTMSVTTYDQLVWTHVTGVGSFGNTYVAADATTTYQKQRTFSWGVYTRTGRQEAQALVSYNRGVTDQYLFIRTFTTVIVRTDGTVIVDVDIRGPGITCVNNSRECNDDDYNDDWGRH